MKTKLTGVLLMVLAALGLASSTILIKLILQMTVLEAQHISLWRFMIAVTLFWFLSLFQGSKNKKNQPIPVKFLILGVVFGGSSFSAMFALDNLPSSIYIIILYIYPSLVVLFSLITGKSVPKLFWLGLPLTFAGLFLTAFDFRSSLLSVNPVGLIITILNALAMSTYLLLSERFFQDGSSKLTGTRWMLTGAMLFSFLWIPFFGFPVPQTGLGWLLIISMGVFGTLVPLLSINIGLQLIGAARGSVIITLQPVAAVLFSTIFLEETLTLQQWVGGGLVIAAIILLQMSADSKAGANEQVEK